MTLGDLVRGYRHDLPVAARVLVFGLVVVGHAGLVWPLSWADPPALVIEENAPLHVRMVVQQRLGDQLPLPPRDTSPPQVPVEALLPPPPEDPAPPRPSLEAMVLPPPDPAMPVVFPVAMRQLAPVPRPPAPLPRPPVPAKPKAPAPVVEQSAAPAADEQEEARRRTLAVGRLRFVEPPRPVYPRAAQKAGEWGVAVVRTLVDITGTPTEVSVDVSSGSGVLDESAADAVRLARFRPYEEGGNAREVWVLIPIQFLMISQR